MNIEFLQSQVSTLEVQLEKDTEEQERLMKRSKELSSNIASNFDRLQALSADLEELKLKEKL